MLAKVLTLFVFISLSYTLTLYANDHNNTIRIADKNTTFALTYWRLINLSNHMMSVEKMRREAHIVFDPVLEGKGRFKGALGCNDMLGKYIKIEDTITIDTKHMAMTRLACPDMETEIQFIDRLSKARSWKIKEQHLEFMDNNGSSIAMFEAVKKKTK